MNALQPLAAASFWSKAEQLVQTHLPIAYENPTFCLLVLGMAVAMGGFYFVTRHRAALIVCAASLLYFVPFVRW